MKLSELRPCVACGGKLVPPPVFHVIEVRDQLACLNERAMRGVFGVAEIIGGMHQLGALVRAEALSPDTDRAVTVAGEGAAPEDREHRAAHTVRLFLCSNCYGGALDLRLLCERAREYEAKIARQAQGGGA